MHKARWKAQQLTALPPLVTSSSLPHSRLDRQRGKKSLLGHVHNCPLNSGGTYRTRHLYPYISTVQWRVATLPGSPLNGIRTFLVLPAPHGEGKRVPAWTPPLPCVVGLSILLLERERQVEHGQFKPRAVGSALSSWPSLPNFTDTHRRHSVSEGIEVQTAQNKARQTFEQCQLP